MSPMILSWYQVAKNVYMGEASFFYTFFAGSKSQVNPNIPEYRWYSSVRMNVHTGFLCSKKGGVERTGSTR